MYRLVGNLYVLHYRLFKDWLTVHAVFFIYIVLSTSKICIFPTKQLHGQQAIFLCASVTLILLVWFAVSMQITMKGVKHSTSQSVLNIYNKDKSYIILKQASCIKYNELKGTGISHVQECIYVCVYMFHKICLGVHSIISLYSNFFWSSKDIYLNNYSVVQQVRGS